MRKLFGARNCERAVDHLEKRALLAQNEAVCLRESKVLPRRGILFQARPIRLVCCKRFELYEAPGDVVGALMREKVADQTAAAEGNDTAPALCVRLECGALEWVDVVADKADDA